MSEDGPPFYGPTIGILTNVTKLNNEWQLESYVYGIAIIWFLLTLYSFVVGINLRSTVPYKDILCRICVILCFSGVLRAVYLMVEPYESKHRMNPWISRLLYTSATPPLYFSFIFIFYSLLRLTKVKMRFYPLKNGTVLMVIMCTFLTLLSSFEMLYLHFEVPILPFYILVLTTFVLWTLAISAAYFRYGFRMINTLASLPDLGGTMGVGVGNIRRTKLKKLAHLADGKNAMAMLSVGVDMAPKIRITDENECTYSYKSENASPALSELSDHSYDSNEESSDQEDPTTNNNAINGGLMVVGERQSSTKNRRRKRKRKKRSNKSTSSSRTVKLRTLVRQGFIPSTLCLIQCLWMVYETYDKFYPLSFRDKWEWLLVVTIFRYVYIKTIHVN